jgi:hypothetical protein
MATAGDELKTSEKPNKQMVQFNLDHSPSPTPTITNGTGADASVELPPPIMK